MGTVHVLQTHTNKNTINFFFFFWTDSKSRLFLCKTSGGCNFPLPSKASLVAFWTFHTKKGKKSFLIFHCRTTKNILTNQRKIDYHLHCTAYDASTTAELIGHDNLEKEKLFRQYEHKCEHGIFNYFSK